MANKEEIKLPTLSEELHILAKFKEWYPKNTIKAKYKYRKHSIFAIRIDPMGNLYINFGHPQDWLGEDWMANKRRNITTHELASLILEDIAITENKQKSVSYTQTQLLEFANSMEQLETSDYKLSN